MKAFILVFTFLTTSFLLNGQIHSSVDIVGGHDFVNSINTNAGIYETGKNRRGFRYGANFNVRILNKTLIRTGMRYVRQGHFAIRDMTTGFLNENNTIDEYYLEIPFMFRYEFNSKNFSPYIEAGLSPHFFVNGKRNEIVSGQLVEEDIEIEYLEGRRFRLTTSIAIGFQVKLSKQYQFFVQPTLRYFRPFTTNQFFRVSTINIGVEVGFRRAISFVNDIDLY